MSAKAETFFEDLKQAVESDQLILPTLPEVALKIRDAVENENTSAQQIAETLTQDASLSARLIQVANSPLYRSRTPIEDLQMAVTRLGIRMVFWMITSEIYGVHQLKWLPFAECWRQPFPASIRNRHCWPA